MTSKWNLAALCALSLMCAPRLAAAQDDPSGQMYGAFEPSGAGQAPPPAAGEAVDALAAFPTAYGARPLTLPAMTLRANAEVRLVHFAVLGTTNFVTLDAGAGFGVTDDLEVGLGTSPIAPILATARVYWLHAGLGGVLRPARGRGFLGPTLYGRYRFAASDVFDAGVEALVLLPANGSDAAIGFGVPLRVRISPTFTLDASFGFLMIFGEDGGGDLDPYFLLSLNVMPRVSFDAFYVGLDTGFLLDPEFPDDTILPMLLEAGATLPVGTTTLDFYGRGGFPALFVPGAPGDKALTDLWELTFGVRAHIGLGAR